ncbi:hypothetical protein S7711_06393 [Stachybotrys chartarum IBT 7711]|uniref:MI domain-containing protein n=1 Tax=Stachybotrys chartarum (strain CBS 109288 / IBT 7711) TaxID=1280523 RepID=A0A084AGD5_STACB|nr:hypothetical protein S7711_06393 [Stachybotrys chartarum IBT 7711]
MPAPSVAELQQKLYKRMGLDAPEKVQQRKPQGVRGYSKPASRKDQRRAHRIQKKSHIYAKPAASNRAASLHGQSQSKHIQSSRKGVTHPRANGKRAIPSEDNEDEDEDEAEDEDGSGIDDEDLGGSSDEDGGGDLEGEPDAMALNGKKGKIDAMPRAVRKRLSRDDAEIEELERKLGIKKGRKSLPQSFKDDGLDELIGDVESEAESREEEPNKRKRDYDEWLSAKRAKTNSGASRSKARHMEEDEDDDGALSGEDEYEDEDGNGEEEGVGSLSDNHDQSSFDGFDSDSDPKAPMQRSRQRENPYVAPTTGAVVAKYVPPSRRKTADSEGEAKNRLRRQIRGQINRLTDANILSIVQAVEGFYQTNARGDVTEILTDAVLTQVCMPETLPDQFFVLTGGFIAAMYKVIGSSFGSHFINRIVMDFGQEYERAISQGAQPSKETSNLITLLSQLYTFEVVSCKIIFDYMERLLSELNELNVELLLRICRMAGRLLRRDDSQTLKHVSTVLNKAVGQVGYANISARTKFMVETIGDLKNSKPKAKGMDSAVVSEHVLRMKKKLGELKSQTRRLEGLAPMGMSLEDIERAGTQGKWWLVGASVPVKPSGRGAVDGPGSTDIDGNADVSTDDEDMDFILPDYPQKARAQGFGTTTQIAIFTALMSAIDHEHGYQQYLQLGLKKDEQLEIARVLVQCVGSEADYNEYYALVGKQACQNGRVRFAFQNRLWRIFRGLGESLFGDEVEDEETADSERMKDEHRLSNVARFYASLIMEGALALSVLKPLELPELNSWTAVFIEQLMISLLQACRSKSVEEEDSRLNRVFGAIRDLPVLAAGVHWILRKRVRKTKLISSKEAKKLENVREKAQSIVQQVKTVE